MIEKDGSTECCFVACHSKSEPARHNLDIWPPSDLPVIRIVMHAACFSSAKSPTIIPDKVKDCGRIPFSAGCVFCGKKLPIIGRHPYALEVRGNNKPDRYWAHAKCIKKFIQLNPVV